MNCTNDSPYIRELYDYAVKQGIPEKCLFCKENQEQYIETAVDGYSKYALFQHLFKAANQVTFDDDLLLAQATDDPGLFLLNNPCPLMIDEVQKCPSIFNRVKIELDKTDEKANFFFTG